MSNCNIANDAALSINAKTQHDLLNGLNQIIGYSEIISEECLSCGQEKYLDDLNKISRAAQCMHEHLETLFSCGVTVSRQCKAIHVQPSAVSAKPVANNPPGREDKSLVGRMLVIDDNPENQEILTRRLSQQGHKVSLAGNGSTALSMLKEQEFDLVLLDVMMPDMDGLEVLQRMKSDITLRKLPVIMISACADIDYVIQCIEAGAEDYLPKPFNSTVLKARISATLEKKRLREQELKFVSQTMQAEAAMDRHRALTQAVAGVAHEINTPLGIVNTGLSIINNRLALPEIQALFQGESEHVKMFEDIMETAELTAKNIASAHRLIENFKKIAVDQQISDTKTVVDLPELLKDAIDLFKISAKQANIETVLDTGGVVGDTKWCGIPGYLMQIVVNFLQNIERYAYPDGTGGKVWITLRDEGEGDTGQFVLKVRDTGVGIRQENLGKVFDPFYTTGRCKGGTGLGLAIVKNIVNLVMHGSVEVVSTLGQGTTFTVKFPKDLPITTANSP